jgi:hypothetical protein
MDVNGQIHATTALPPGKEPPLPIRLEVWPAPRASLEGVAKRKIPTPTQESNPDRPDRLASSLVATPTELPRLFYIRAIKL